MKVYLAGPYTLGDVAQNVRTVLDIAEEVVKRGHSPYIPHLSHFWHFVHPHDYEFWLKYDLEWLEVCDALLRLPGQSKGADGEVGHANKLNIPVYHKVEEQ